MENTMGMAWNDLKICGKDPFETVSNLIFEPRFLLWGVINGEMDLHPHGSSC